MAVILCTMSELIIKTLMPSKSVPHRDFFNLAPGCTETRCGIVWKEQQTSYTMKTIRLAIGIAGYLLSVAAYGQAGEKAAIIDNYFAGWRLKDWNLVEKNLAQGFTFTSAAPDDHLTIDNFKQKCWPQAEHIKRVEFARIAEGENDAFAIVQVITMDERVLRNVEYFTFSNGKIKSIEVFFGGSGLGYPTNKKQ
jgi:hypothetical protein